MYAMLPHSNYSGNLMYSTPRYSTNGTLALIMVIGQWLQHSNVSINIFLFKINILDAKCCKLLQKFRFVTFFENLVANFVNFY